MPPPGQRLGDVVLPEPAPRGHHGRAGHRGRVLPLPRPSAHWGDSAPALRGKAQLGSCESPACTEFRPGEEGGKYHELRWKKKKVFSWQGKL